MQTTQASQIAADVLSALKAFESLHTASDKMMSGADFAVLLRAVRLSAQQAIRAAEAPVVPAARYTRDQFSDAQIKALVALFNSSAGNGHDFGFVEDLKGVLPKAIATEVARGLEQMGVIRICEPVTNDSGRWTQIQFHHVADMDAFLDTVAA